MSKILKFPEVIFILKCKYCGSNNFNIQLKDKESNKIIGYSCVNCEEFWELKIGNFIKVDKK